MVVKMHKHTGIAVRCLVALLCTALIVLPAQQTHATSTHSSYGGTLTVAVAADPLDFDPPLSFNWTDYYMLPDSFNGLMTYAPGTTRLEPDIATSFPTVSKDGLVYTFTLRKGVLFQPPVNREVHAADFKYSWERALNPKTASPAISYLLHIAGAKAYNQGKAKEVSGIKVLGPYTLQVTLTRPYVAFNQIVAQAVTYVVPHEIADKYPANSKNGQDFSHHAVGTGAFILSKWVPDQEIIWTRNPHYFHAGLPYLDEIDLKIVQQTSIAQLQLKRDEIDLIADGIAGLDYLRFSRDPQWQHNIDTMNASAISYLSPDTSSPPFNNRLVRQALAMALDRKRLLAVDRGVSGGTIYDHIYAPGVPCQDPHLQGWPYDPARARQLLAKAGYPHGLSTSILRDGSSTTGGRPELVLQRELAAVGIKAQIKTLTGAAFQTAHLSPGKGMSFDGFAIDFPDPSDVVDAELLSSDAVSGAGSDPSLYKNPQVDQLAAQGDAEQNQQKRCAIFSKIEDIVHQDAAWIPLYSWKWSTIHSSRVTDLNLGPMTFDFDYRNVKVQ
jgi:peptide/nickel transport system substrate-binding protein